PRWVPFGQSRLFSRLRNRNPVETGEPIAVRAHAGFDAGLRRYKAAATDQARGQRANKKRSHQPLLRGRATLAVLAADSPFALVAYQSRKYIKCALSLLAWQSAALFWLMFANTIFVAVLFGKARVVPWAVAFKRSNAQRARAPSRLYQRATTV